MIGWSHRLLAAAAVCLAGTAPASAAPADFVWTNGSGTTYRINVVNLEACQDTKDGASLDNETGQLVVVYSAPNCHGLGVAIPSGARLSVPFQSVITPEVAGL